MSLLKIEHLKVFYGNAQAINDISLEIEESSFVSFIGANGAGKSTIVDTISNLTQWQGHIIFEDTDLSRLQPSEIVRLGIINCPERRNIFPYMNVEQNLLMGAYTSRNNIKENLELVFALFPKLKERLKQNACTMSGGEQRMLTIGRALMSNPKMLMVDEPTIGLAPVLVRQLSQTIGKLKRKKELTILLMEQNVNLALEHSDIIYVLERGQIVTRGTPSEIESQNSIKGIYLPNDTA